MNPQKTEKKLQLTTHHRVVVVVYIPNAEGFYQNMFAVFKTCLESLSSTINSSCAITVVNNGSHQEVTDYLNACLADHTIDALISHKTNIGKIDALVGAARGSREPLITLTDADILFVKGWQNAVEEVFLRFPKAGSVSPIPVKNGLYYGTISTLNHILMGRSAFKYCDIPENAVSYNRYLESINWGVEEYPGKNWPVIEKNGFKAIVGSGHQVLTIRRDLLFTTVPTPASLTLVGGRSEYRYVDEPIDYAGLLRLATYNNFGYHMGNELEPWMLDIQQQNHSSVPLLSPESSFGQADLFASPWGAQWYKVKKRLVKKIFSLLYKQRK
jgi:hypothetical protein